MGAVGTVEAVNPRTVLLDLDGTLVDSATGITEHLTAAMVVAGGRLHPAATLRGFIGPPFEAFMPGLGLDPNQIRAATAEYRRTYDPVAASLSLPYPGVIELLERLRAKEMQLAIATSKPESLARAIIADNGLGSYFQVIGGADVASGRTGKAAVIGSVLARLDLLNDSSPVMVGDRLHDVLGAAAHGLATIGVSWGYAETDELVTAGAVVVVDTPAALGGVLLGQVLCAGISHAD